MALTDLKTQMDAIVVRTEKRMLLVTQTAIQKMIKESQTTTFKGGSMRVDTGFLRNSGVASLNTVPVGQSRGRRRLKEETAKPLKDYEWDEKPSFAVVARLKIGDVFYFGWTARYAKYREARDGFLEKAVMNWQKHVDEAIAVLRKKDGK